MERLHLLVRHRKLDRWLQPGGHSDGEPDAARTALREAREETGIRHFDFLQGRGMALDLDVHVIPARAGEVEHEHHDVRFLLRAGATQTAVSEESDDIQWFSDDEVRSATGEESVLRMLVKARRLLG